MSYSGFITSWEQEGVILGEMAIARLQLIFPAPFINITVILCFAFLCINQLGTHFFYFFFSQCICICSCAHVLYIFPTPVNKNKGKKKSELGNTPRTLSIQDS